jgi:hypothetical protein
MAALPLAGAGAAAAVLAWALAQNPTHADDGRAQTLILAVPGDQGSVSAGLFSPSGSLVRSLGELAPVRDFSTGLNGLILEWDGRDQHGRPVTPGAYRVAGWYVPETVRAEGVAVHFNDWPASDGSLPLGGVTAVVPGVGEEMLLAGSLADGSGSGFWAVGSEDGLLEERARVTGMAEVLCVDASHAVLRPPGGAGIVLRALGGEEAVGLFEDRRVVAAALGGGALFVSTGGGDPLLTKLGVDFCGMDPLVVKTPAVPTLLAADGAERIFASDGALVWQWSGGEFSGVPLGDPVVVSALAAGGEGTVWVAGRVAAEGGHAFVRQYSPDGTLLREWKPGRDAPTGIFVGHDPLRLFVLTSGEPNGPQRLQGLRPVAGSADPAASTEGVADWEVFLDRSITPAPLPSFAEGVVVPAPPLDRPPSAQSLNIRILPNSLNPTRRIGELRAAFGPQGAWIESSDGLRVAEVCDLASITRVAIARGEDRPDTLRVLVSVPGGALEYMVAGLRDLVRLDGGTIEP